MHYISSPAGIENIVSFARLSNAQYVYGLIVDIYTERMLCNNCNAGLIGMQHSPEKGFIFDINTALKKNRIAVRENGNTMFSVRVSYTYVCKGGSELSSLLDDRAQTHTYNPDETNILFQAKNNLLDPSENYHASEYRGSFFTSSSFSSSKLEKAISPKKKQINMLF